MKYLPPLAATFFALSFEANVLARLYSGRNFHIESLPIGKFYTAFGAAGRLFKTDRKAIVGIFWRLGSLSCCFFLFGVASGLGGAFDLSALALLLTLFFSFF